MAALAPSDRQPLAREEAEASRQIVCWSRMQAEAGQQLERIVARKELERRAGAGLFFWGVGSPPSTAVQGLARTGAVVPVIFSVMRTRPKPRDVSPEQVLAWRHYVDAEGIVRPVPDHVLVTSRASRRGYHYALVCRSDEPLALGDYGSFDPDGYRNVGGTGARVGASQVTVLLRRHAGQGVNQYRVNLRARLAHSFWVKLIDPMPVSWNKHQMLESLDINSSLLAWIKLVTFVRGGSASLAFGLEQESTIDQLRLFDS